MMLSADKQNTAGKSRDGQADFINVVDCQQFELGTRFDHADFSLLGHKVNASVGGNRRSRIAGATDPLAINLLARGGLVSSQHSGVGANI